MPVFKKLNVTIQCNGRALPEYIDHGEPAENDSTIVRYIESLDNAEFSVAYNTEEGFSLTSPALRFKLFLDGKFVGDDVPSATFILEEMANGRQYSQKIAALKYYSSQGLVSRCFAFARIRGM